MRETEREPHCFIKVCHPGPCIPHLPCNHPPMTNPQGPVHTASRLHMTPSHESRAPSPASLPRPHIPHYPASPAGPCTSPFHPASPLPSGLHSPPGPASCTLPLELDKQRCQGELFLKVTWASAFLRPSSVSCLHAAAPPVSLIDFSASLDF